MPAAPATLDDFLAMVAKSGVVESARLESHLRPLRAAGRLPAYPPEVADLLVRDGFLTRFQADSFLQGKYLGFTLGKFKILDLLGSGGMSAVYLCEDKQRRRFALKVLPRALAKDPIILKRFYREARASAALDHPNIVRAYEAGQEQQQHFFVMEYVDGLSLQDLVKQKGRLPIPQAAGYIRQAAVGLEHAHKAGLVHRDIKPGNLLLNRKGIVKILDMGLSRFNNNEKEESVLTKDVLGTLDYLAPEQAYDSHTVDVRADIYSLGGSLYYLLTGQSPLATENDTLDPRVLAQKANQPKPLRELRPELPAALIAIVEKMMAPDPRKRFPTPADVADALLPWADPATIRDEVPPSRRSRLAGIHSDRRPPWRWAVIALCLLAALAIGVALWLALRT
jgi:serine/threonine protein kinase